VARVPDRHDGSSVTVNLDIPAVIAELTVEEKASLCSGSSFWHTEAIGRAGIPAVMVSDGPHGLRKAPASDAVGVTASTPATCFPTGSALGSTWNVELVHRVGVALGEEARAEGVAVLLGPGINIKRSPLCGRNFEYLSEDPVLAGELGGAWVRGVQSQGVGASLKHFAANNQEHDRQRISADVDERPLREIYLAGFERAVRGAQPWTVMCSYNRLNGVQVSESRWLLTEILREAWGYDGVVVSDWGAVKDRVAALAAGLDLEMPYSGGDSDAQIVTAVRSGQLDERLLDHAVHRVLTLLTRVLPASASEHSYNADAHHDLARIAAREGAVLLKNDDHTLPLRPRPGQRLVVLGEFARTPRYQGSGSSQVNPTRVDSPIDGLRAAVDDGVRVDFAAGFGVDVTDDDEQLLTEAVNLARGADMVVVFLGLPPSFESEGFDRDHMDLPANQLELLAGVAGVRDRVVVVLANGSAVTLSSWQHHASAILESWLGGQAVGGAVADLLLGVANPSGRLAETLPLQLPDTPSYLNFPGEDGHVRYGEGVFVGYRYYDALDREVSYPFGHGLSYTTFEYSNLDVVMSGTAEQADLELLVTVTVTNTGDAAGHEVLQVYVADPEASVRRPQRELKAFAKVALEPGASKVIQLNLTGRDLSYWSASAGRWRTEGGTFNIAVGASSRDIRLSKSVEVAGDGFSAPLGATSTLQEWLDHPDGGRLLRDSLATRDGAISAMIGDDESARMMGQFTLGTLATFGMGFGSGDIAALVDELARRDD
jgi:beta-glucosidase